MFSKLDLQKGYFQVSPEDITTIITPLGMFEFLCMPFGLRNTGNRLQPLMDQVLGDLLFCLFYVDDILSSARIFPLKWITFERFFSSVRSMA